MPRGDRALRAIGRLLPREFRERVFEPALSDLAPDDSRVLFCADCLRLGLPLFVWRRGRPTRMAMVILVGLALGVLANQRVRYAATRRISEHSTTR